MKQCLFIIGILLALPSAEGFVKDPIYDDLEGYELVTALIKDSKWDLAWEELKKKDIQVQDPARYHLLLGQYYYGKDEWKKALSELKTVSVGPWKEAALLYQARANSQSKNDQECVEAYSKINVLIVGVAPDSVWWSACAFRLKKYQMSWKILEEAQKQYQSFAVLREKVSLKIKLNMFHEAYLEAAHWFGQNPGFSSQYLDVSEELHAVGATDAAIHILEQGRVRDPLHLDINLTLSQLYFQKGMLQAAEEGFVRAAQTDAKYFYHSAEINRQLGRIERSLYFNGFVQEPKEKLKQKIASYVDVNKFPLIASLESILARSELAKDDEVKYALAYSLVKMGQVEEPLQYLSSITKPELIEKTTLLRKTLLDCQEKKQSCRL